MWVERLGALRRSPSSPPRQRYAPSNLEVDGSILAAEDRRRMFNLGNRLWHIGTIHGWPRPEAMALIRDLTEHATQRELVYRHTWRPHDLVIWDNRCTMHRGRAFDDRQFKRDLRRLTLQDSAPTLDQPA